MRVSISKQWLALGVLFIPVDKKQEIINYLKKIRLEYRYAIGYNLKFGGSHTSSITKKVIRSNLDLFNHIIQSNPKGLTKLYNFTGKDKYESYKNISPFLELSDNYGCKFGLLKIADNFQNMSGMNYARKVETTCRFLLKGCCHGMFDGKNKIEINKLFFDGDKHHNGHIDLATICKGYLRNYCCLSPNISLDSTQINQRDDNSKLLINFVDNIVGAFVSLLNNENKHSEYIHPLNNIYKRLIENKIFSNVNGRWYKSISFSEFKIKDDEINFPDIFRNKRQKTLF